MMGIRPAGRLWLGLASALAATAGLAASAVADEVSASSSSATDQAAGVSATGYTSAFVCGRCHADIYESWKRSMHAFSVTDPIFDAAYMQALKADPNSKALCLSCHAPVTLTNKDLDLTQGITREGVTCDFCHTVTAANVGNRETPYVVSLGRVKRSTMTSASSPAHDVAYSDLHATAEFCGACHYYESENGTVVMGTFKEWQEGPYAREGVRCQDCHMVLAGGRVVRPEVKPESGPINLHDLIHDTDQVKRALEVRITDLDRTKGGLVATVEVANVGSGHMIPTGVPNRTVVLQVEARRADGTLLRQEKTYQKVVGGPDGTPLTQDHEAFLYARSILSDNRIGPRERRSETFFFRVGRDERVEVTATATYRYTPLVLDRRSMTITLSSDARTAPAGRNP